MTSEVKQRCFVIMPFSKTNEKHTEEYWTNHYETFIKRLVESNHPLIAARSFPLRGDILRQIITDLLISNIVVADLTDANPNVYWELGVRQSFKHCTVTIAEEGTRLPFDVGGKGTLFYFPQNHIKMKEFENQFKGAIDDCLSNPSLPDSFVLETISGRGTLYQILMRDESIRRLDAFFSEIERNESVFAKELKRCKENIENEKKTKQKEENTERSIGTYRYSSVSVEMLVVSRYLNADKTFYQVAENYMDTLIRHNAQLSIWEISPSSFESWFIKASELLGKRISKFKELLLEQKKVAEGIL